MLQQQQYAQPGLQHEHHQEDSSVELPLLQQQQQQYAPPHEHHQEDSLVETMFQQVQLEGELKQEIDEDSDNSSTDSAFQMPPKGISYWEMGSIYIDCETEMKLGPLRKKELDKLDKLPYVLREVNQPISSNPCIF